MNASTSNTLAGQKRLAARLIAHYKRNADSLPSSGFGLRAKVLSAILLMRGYEAFMYSKRNPYPKVIALLRWQLEYLECTRTSYSSTAAEPPSKIGNKTKAKRSIANDLHFQDLYKNLWGHFDQLSFRRFGERVAARLRVLTAGGGLKGMRGLDVGCGSGAYTFGAAALGAHCIGIDPGVGNISFARKIAKRTGAIGVLFRKGSAYKLEFAAGIFDFVICIGVLHHLEDPEQALREMHRVLKPSGYLYINDDGAGGMYNSLWDAVLHIFSTASVRETADIVEALKVSPNAQINFMDGFFLHYERRSLKSLVQLLRSAGFSQATLLKGSAPHDLSALDFTNDSYFVDKFGAGALRMQVYK